MIRYLKHFLVGAGLLAGLTLQAATVQLDPFSGDIFGTPGSTVGWGYTITNTTDYLVVTASAFCSGPLAQPCPNALGTYTDFTAFNFIVVGPAPESTSVSQSFNASLLTGIGSFTINPGALVGDSIAGSVFVLFDLYSRSPNDPNFDPTTDFLSSGVISTAASVSVVAVPEPASLVLLGSALVLAAASRRFRR
jgi:hypothetical protein